MLLIEGINIKKYYGDRLILNIEDFKIYSEDRIGLVGLNGSGKTTLINILCGESEPDEGLVRRYGIHSVVDQLGSKEYEDIDKKVANQFGTQHKWNNNLSGGEKTRFKMAKCFDKGNNIIFADEPTSNLDVEGIELLNNKFKEYRGALLIISHDREFLDKLCNKIVEIDEGKLKEYKGNYTDFKLQKDLDIERSLFEFNKYGKDKKKLEDAMDETKQKVGAMRKAPARMGNSEARLHSKMGNQKAKANLDRAARNMKARMDHLEVKEKPKKIQSIKLDALDNGELYSKIVISGKNISKSFGDKIIFNNTEFDIYNCSRTALIGPNGSGKSTLIKMILEGDISIKTAKGAKIGYFSQDMNILNEEFSILENVMENSVYDETFARILLSRLLFKKEEVYKKVKALSGGERVKASFVKVFLSDINLLVLDEPTNYLDIYSLEVVEAALKEYGRTLLFVSHDRRFISTVANSILSIEKHKLITVRGSYEEFMEKSSNKTDVRAEALENQIFVLENRLSGIISKLSVPSRKDDPEKLDREYFDVLKKLKELKIEID
ncbi:MULTISPECIES: ribosomal protection-like ABC-F family protein [Clostridium]|uniref:ribosomal protection-like ABC-F family protein n=1 Tax=Clostridium TaxID=1485 RepID=UPI0013E97109|nr:MULTISPECIES: ABC-F type ribosomal protection protein [Clostridium]MBW9158075.1 ABC-F type ribosomal protection protein [Clostridium tagluense]MBZ9622188.1 ABC-F type ribosomal protection protein [Clostridium sp. FP2]MBZ9633749.1 ABC-F type ribosomal protection protein [Clostridium sp. FP1]WLC66498.1 ABC-F type ribosomal protection protein [Clostridium tagluense]